MRPSIRHLTIHSLTQALFTPVEGLQAAASDAAPIKAPQGKKKGKKSAPRQRQAKITNTHLKGTGIDLTKDYVAPGAQK